MTWRTAVLGWGSLLWDEDEEFDAWHGPWQDEGPVLRIEFSRISKKRSGALTLVIDPKNGAPTQVCWSISLRPTLDQAVEDLRLREETNQKRVGRYSVSGDTNGFDQASISLIEEWCRRRGLDGVVWTDLPSNFEERTHRQFSVDAAVQYLKTLDCVAWAKAFEYIQNAPKSVQTPLRAAFLENAKG